MDNFTTVSLPREIRPKDIAIIQKRCLRILRHGNLRVDGSAVETLDFFGETFLADIATAAESSNRRCVLKGFAPSIREKLSKLTINIVPEKDDSNKMSFVERLGDGGFKVLQGFRDFAYLLSECAYWTIFKPFDKNHIPFHGTALQLFRLGSNACGIVFLLVFLIAFSLAFQSSNMLNAVGGGSYLAGGLGFLMFAEIGPLLSSIILAGRSGSSITAEIASMTVAEEIKALRTMGIPPIQFLVLPRFKALSVAVPILSFCSSIFGCLAGMIVADLVCEISPYNYILSMKDGINIVLIVKSMIKSLVFGWIIALVAAQKGLNVRGGADAVGKATTSCVVTSISGIIIADAIFSFIYY
ncbi:MAG: ABC transporter permease [Fibrobacter sp.]|nr:ABC transporter permease [Fibrobacter sp.]MDY6369150.1 ABC transporter permease [Fibrobacter sp.]MDY6390251.1 ABC transporter permease [Fibrobacter sp.]